MKLQRTRLALIIGVAAIATAVIAYKSTRPRVYSLAIYSAGVSYYNQLSIGSGPNSWGVQQYAEVGWLPQHNPHPRACTEVSIGSHKVRIRTPFCLIGTPGLCAVGAAALFLFGGFAWLLHFRPRGDH